jgi:hypothetical protein
MAAAAPRGDAGLVNCGEHKLSLSFELKAAVAADAAGAAVHDTLLISAVSTTTDHAEYEGAILTDGELVTRDDLAALITSLRERRGFRLEALMDNAQGFRVCFERGVTCLLRPKASNVQVARLQAQVALLTATLLRSLHFAILSEDAPSGTPAGTTTVNAWFKRRLTTVVHSAIPGLEIREGGILPPRGTYWVQVSVPGFYCDRFTSRLVSSRGNTVVGLGTSEYAHQAASHTASHSSILAVVTVDGAEVLHIEQIIAKCNVNCLGVETSVGKPERYTTVKIQEVASPEAA